MIDLDELEELEKKATPGPWKHKPGEHDKTHADVWGPRDGELYEPVCRIPADDVTTKGMREVKANTKLIVSLRNATPKLIEEVKRLREEAKGRPLIYSDAENRAWNAGVDACVKMTRYTAKDWDDIPEDLLKNLAKAMMKLMREVKT